MAKLFPPFSLPKRGLRRGALAFSATARSNPDMRHARREDLDRLEPLLARLRQIPGLKEKSRGVFYRGSRAFLHFHEDKELFFADARLKDDFERFPATSSAEQKKLVATITSALSALK